jgi:hypothetical protein
MILSSDDLPRPEGLKTNMLSAPDLCREIIQYGFILKGKCNLIDIDHGYKYKKNQCL